ncbi:MULTISPECIES: signal peptidase II [unclassified Janibacter]|uniref:signal peptidase II n=1 Tax=unclassified Janibacter TaxID=2649294 RepID=UPI003CFDB3A3
MQDEAGAPLSADQTTPPSTREHTGRLGAARATFVLAALAALILDQLTKIWATSALREGRTIDLIGDLLSLRLLRNSGAAFSLGDSRTWVMTLVALTVTIGIAWVARRVGSTLWGAALGLMFGGSLGNLVDRFVREPGPLRGHVVDFIDYFGLFVGNVADIAIVVGAGLLVLQTLRGVSLDGLHPAHADHTHTSGRVSDGTVAPVGDQSQIGEHHG